jgi:hypothetical protein
MKKLLMALSLVFVMALMLAPAALAEKPVQDPNCSFEKGNTTCTTTEKTGSYITTKTVGYGYAWCGPYLRFTPATSNQDYQTDVYETKTTVYKGKSDKVESTETTTSEVGPYAVGGTYTLGC